MRAAVFFLAAALALQGCASWLAPFLPGNEVVPTPTTETIPQTPAPLPTVATEPVAPIPGVTTITLWVPPQFNPESENSAGSLLRAHLDAFMEANPGVLIVTRVKASSGAGGLLESLTASVAAAPGSVPSIVALTRSDLEQAAVKGLILPLDGVSDLAGDPDWYEYARQVGRVQNSTFGLPFAGDALVLVHRPAESGQVSLASWEDIFNRNLLVVAPIDDGQAMFTLAQYHSAGGKTQDPEGRPFLDKEILTQVLTNYGQGIGRGSFPTWLTQIQTNGQAWQSFLEGQGSMVIAYSSNFLADLPPDAAVASLPGLDGQPSTLATGWSWALADTNPLTRETSVKLMEYLSDSTFLADWTAAAGYLPTRPSVLTGWSNQTLTPVLNQVILSAEVKPANEVLTGLGPVLREAVLSVFNGLATPEQAAETAVGKLGGP